MAKYTAIYDACVLYPAPLRDFLLQLAISDLFRARWTKDIHEEWQRNVLQDRPDLKASDLERTRQLMDSHVRDCLIEGYEPLKNPLKSVDEYLDCIARQGLPKTVDFLREAESLI